MIAHVHNAYTRMVQVFDFVCFYVYGYSSISYNMSKLCITIMFCCTDLMVGMVFLRVCIVSPCFKQTYEYMHVHFSAKPLDECAAEVLMACSVIAFCVPLGSEEFGVTDVLPGTEGEDEEYEQCSFPCFLSSGT